jgi:N-acyl-D-amino-acid deacylase
MLSCLVTGARVADGMGSPLVELSVGITEGRIRILDPEDRPPAGQTIDASGCVLAPGFIDIHSHNDLVAVSGYCLNDKISQGVTTEVVGNCGYSPFPITQKNQAMLDDLLTIISPGHWTPAWHDWSGYAQKSAQAGCQANLIGQVGHAMLRSAVMGMEMRAPTAPELREMQRLLAHCLDSGASGLSFGLMYHPSGFAEAEEITALCSVAAQHDTFVSVHLRSYSNTGLLPAMQEMIAAAERSGARLLISHLSPAGKHAPHLVQEMFSAVEVAQARGVDIAFDRYPYEHAFSRLSLLFPKWILEGDPAALATRLRDPATIDRVLPDIDQFVAAIGYDCIELTGSQSASTGVDPARCAADLLLALGTSAAIILRLSDIPTQKRVLSHSLCMVGSDGVPCLGGTHPRTFGTFARVLGPFVRGAEGLALPNAIYKMTGQPATWLGLRDRGRIANDTIADLVIFDPLQIADRSTFERAYEVSAGIQHVFIGGQPVVTDGKVMNPKLGKILSCRASSRPATPA